MTPRLPSRDFLIWLAGFLDGEGSFTYGNPCRDERGPRVRLYCANTCREVLVQIQEELGRGRVVVKNDPKRNPRHKIGYHWIIEGSGAIAVAKLVFPFLRVKKRQAELFLRFPIQRVGRNRSASEALTCEAIVNKLRVLNRRGPHGGEEFNAPGPPAQGSLALEDLTPEETVALKAGEAEITRGEWVRWDESKRRKP